MIHIKDTSILNKDIVNWVTEYIRIKIFLIISQFKITSIKDILNSTENIFTCIKEVFNVIVALTGYL